MALPKTYNGGKEASGVYQTIINYITPHQIYIEPFLGRGTILRLKKPAPQYNIGCELDKELWLKWLDYKREQKLYHIITHNMCGISFLRHIRDNSIFTDLGRHVYIYCDPPYLMETRSTQRKLYVHEFTREKHIDLLTLVKELPFNISISCYDNSLYQEHLKGWNKIQFKAQTRRGTATETLYFNYPQPKELHDYSFLGKDFRDRYRIHQKIERHVNGLKRLPELERNAIIHAISQL